MSLGKYYSLREAARVLGIHRDTLKAWLFADFAMEFPALPRGGKMMISESMLEAVVRRRLLEALQGQRAE